MPRPGRHGPPLYPAYLVGVNIWNNLVFGNLGRWCTNQHFKDPNSSSYWPPWQLFHLLQSGHSFTSCSFLDSVSTPLEAIWQRGASSPWPFSPCATQKQWQTWFHSLTKSIFTWAFEQKALKLSERIGGELGWTARWLARLFCSSKSKWFCGHFCQLCLFRKQLPCNICNNSCYVFIEHSRSLTLTKFSPL